MPGATNFPESKQDFQEKRGIRWHGACSHYLPLKGLGLDDV
jgi:hypothetical protein